MQKSNIKLIVGIFSGVDTAELIVKHIIDARKNNSLQIDGAVAIQKDANSKVNYQDVGLTPAKGAAAGVVLGATVGLLTGGIGLVMGAIGGIIGSLIGRKSGERELMSDQIYHVLAALSPDSSALLVVTKDQSAEQVEEILEESGADVITADVSSEMASKLEAYREEAYSALKN